MGQFSVTILAIAGSVLSDNQHFEGVDPDYPTRARKAGPHAVIGGRNHGQGSSREHAALVPRPECPSAPILP